MLQPNIKIYLILSGVLAVLLIAILIIPFNRKTKTASVNQTNYPTPTAIYVVSQQPNTNPTVETNNFTGVSEEELPTEVASLSLQKQELRGKVPFDTGLFSLDFNYSEDKFAVSLNEPKNENLKQFEEWKRINYPDVPMDQFIFN